MVSGARVTVDFKSMCVFVEALFVFIMAPTGAMVLQMMLQIGRRVFCSTPVFFTNKANIIVYCIHGFNKCTVNINRYSVPVLHVILREPSF